MIANGLRRLWSEGRPTLNGWLSIGNPFTAEIMAAQGYDSVSIDVQHGALDFAPRSTAGRRTMPRGRSAGASI